jgi:hypothetical protein
MAPTSDLLNVWQQAHGFADWQLAKALGLSEQTIKGIHRGRSVRPATAELLSYFTGIPVNLFKLYTSADHSHPMCTSQAFTKWSAVDGVKALCTILGISCDAAFLKDSSVQKIKEKLKKISED